MKLQYYNQYNYMIDCEKTRIRAVDNFDQIIKFTCFLAIE